jgi:hypothetical protein
MLKSEVTEVYNMAREQILSSMSTTRTDKNLNQYLYLD